MILKITIEHKEDYEVPLCETVETVGNSMLCTSIDDWGNDTNPFN